MLRTVDGHTIKPQLSQNNPRPEPRADRQSGGAAVRPDDVAYRPRHPGDGDLGTGCLAREIGPDPDDDHPVASLRNSPLNSMALAAKDITAVLTDAGVLPE